jgi:hypothetical protein
MGGIQNFLKQHNPGASKACKVNLQKKKKASTHQQSQPWLQAFFTKQQKVLIPPTVPTTPHMIAYAMESNASGLAMDTVPSTCPTQLDDVTIISDDEDLPSQMQKPVRIPLKQ